MADVYNRSGGSDMTSQRMSDSEMLHRIDAVQGKLDAGFLNVRADLAVLTAQAKMTNGRLTEVELWKARTGGFLLALTLFASGPAVVLGFYALYQAFR